MTECIKSGHIVLPIFYHVEPTHVRKQEGSFGEIFSHLSRKYKEDVEKWKEALREVGSIKGWEPAKTADGHEGKLVEQVVIKVLSELKKAFLLVVPEQLVGIENAVKAILRLLDDNANDTQIIGIHGMGGIGKTTLAKVVYNNLLGQFQYHSFIADIRESSRRNSIPYLQQQLIADMKEEDRVFHMDGGIRILESRFKHKKVLILLDDVDDINQITALVGKFDWFAMGSKIIITTRSRFVLEKVGVKNEYELKEIAEDESLILFSRHAFLKDSPPSEFDSLSRAIVSTTGGLPLALEVIGSSLCGRKRKIWEETLKELQKVPHERVREKLMISYNALNYNEKQIFLDIACFFIGEDLRYASYMWDACGYGPWMGIETLSFMSLIKIGDHGKVQMHDQLRDLGREIVQQEDYEVPMNRSRLWMHDEAVEVLERHKEIQKVRVRLLCLDKDWTKEDFFLFPSELKREFTTEQFQTLPNLRFLAVRGAKLIGDSRNLLYDLRWLMWRGRPAFVATNFCLEKLVILDLSRSDISERWEGWSHLKMLKHLKVLDLRGCNCLNVTPDLSAFPNLEIFQLKACRNLKQIHPSIGAAKGLIFLDLQGCDELQELPQEMGKLGNLEELDATGCKSLRGEIHIVGLFSLKILRLNLTGVFGFHGTFDKFSCLEKLELDNCKMLQSLPELPASLTVLKVTGQYCTLPRLSHLIHLKALTVRGCPLLEFMPELPSGLLELAIIRCSNLKELPNLSSLEFLSKFLLNSCGELMEIKGLEGLKSLARLTIAQCSKLSNLDGIEHLQSLTWLLLLSNGPIFNDDQVSGLEKLKNLEQLNIQNCQSLARLDVSQLTRLEELVLCRCHNLLEIKGIERLKKLKKLDISGCPSIDIALDLSCFDSLRYVGVDERLNLPDVQGVTIERCQV
ncbi:disease resistance protein RUN1-like [Eucalyptus grandis]|uniref:disease resistance protein RUN1-like n=1 Tax=Eucalyptus grandis TaxID=71139 RepID=UPI00192E8539|nr:disease resistance protein RUN1-like [Eucalyptus grandis]XP_039167588.1 disease resistance protein RUN1-like [Eucalyptus grandis]XP_039167589.1 disease resistance protein RUN1-like [Eucalyptus grandis]